MKHNHCLLFMILLFVFTGCDTNKGKVKMDEASSMYISFTTTYEKDKKFLIDVLYLNLDSKKVDKITTIPYESQYPLAVYDKNADKVYYSSETKDKAGSKAGDQLFEYDINTHKVKQLTTDLYAINYIIPTSDAIYLAARPIDSRVEQPYIIHKGNDKVIKLTWDPDLYVWNMNIDPQTDTVVLSGYSSKERDEEIANQENKPFEYGINSIHLLTQNKHRIIKKTAHGNMNSIWFDEKHDINYIIDGESKHIDDSNKESELELSNDIHTDNIMYSSKNGIYYLDGDQQICYYDKINREEIVLYKTKANSAINNAQILNEK